MESTDIVIKGYLVSVEEGSASKRVLIGFGSGNAELKTMVEGFQMTDHGFHQLGSGDLDSGAARSPDCGGCRDREPDRLGRPRRGEAVRRGVRYD